MFIKTLIKRAYKRLLSFFIIPPSLFKKSLFLLKFNQTLANRLKFGFCPLCGKFSFMIIRNSNLRETGDCLYCSANSRYKAIAEIIKRIIIIKNTHDNLNLNLMKLLLGKLNLSKISLKQVLNIIKFKEFWIYEPSSVGAVYEALKKHPKFIKSEFFPNPDLKPGDYFKEIRFEDLHSLSFENNYFDLVITLDVFEHVRNPELAFKEIYRILKPNGVHLFTVPIEDREKTIKRIDNKDRILITPIIYHADSIRSNGPVVYTDWGLDIIEYLNRINFPSFIFKLKDHNLGIFAEIIIIISLKR